MLAAFENYVQKNKLFSRQDKLLLAISGGEDSVCLFHLLLKNKYEFAVAHCNFQLRGADSDTDELFVKTLAENNRVPFFSTRFDTKKEARDLKAGIQETARKLRYDWFNLLMDDNGFAVLLTAHHQSDNAETMLINMLRSSGISGLHGIPVRTSRIARPLMFANRIQISEFIAKNKFAFRLDESNLSDDYMRNHIRHHVMPELRRIEPDIDAVMSTVATQVLEFEQLALEMMDKIWDQLTSIRNGRLRMEFENLKTVDHLEALLYYKLRDYGFNKSQIQAIANLEEGQVGKRIEAAEWVLIRERNAYILSRHTPVNSALAEINRDTTSLEIGPYTLDLAFFLPYGTDYRKPGFLFLDISSGNFPLSVRPWKSGDRMQPFGMTGSKKISDILTDRKIEHSHRKEQFVISANDGTILALLPDMICESCKVTPASALILSIQVKPLYL